MTYGATNSLVSREEEPPHTSHHGAREISRCKNKEYKKAKCHLFEFALSVQIQYAYSVYTDCSQRFVVFYTLKGQAFNT